MAENHLVRPPFPTVDNVKENRQPEGFVNKPLGSNANVPLSTNAGNGIQQMNPTRNFPVNQQMLQQPFRNMPPNHQQGSRILPQQGVTHVRFPNNLNMVRSNGPSLINGPQVYQMHSEQPRLPNSTPAFGVPPTDDGRSVLQRQPSNQTLHVPRPPQFQQVQNQGAVNIEANYEEAISDVTPEPDARQRVNERMNTNLKLNNTEGVTAKDKEVKINSTTAEQSDNVKNNEIKEEKKKPSSEKTHAKEKNSNSGFFEEEEEEVRKNLFSGVVLKKIKYFEERDTAKTPLTPKIVTADISDYNNNNNSHLSRNTTVANGGGVDETPLYHPNLRNILETPINLAKIPLYKIKRGNKHRGTLGGQLGRNRMLTSKWKTLPEDILKVRRANWCWSTKISDKPFRNFKKQNIVHFTNKETEEVRTFKPDEELLQFFYDSQTMRSLKYGEIKTNQNRGQTRSGVANGDLSTPRSKSQSRLPANRSPLSLATDSPLKSPGTPKTKSLPRTPENPTPPTPTNKKLPMNKIQVGAAPSPNLRAAKSKVGSLVNTTHKPGGGNIRIESHKIDFSKTQSRIEAKNDQYVRSGGDKKIPQVKLQWEAKSKVGSLENSTYKPGGGDKKIESVKLDFKEKAKSKVGSKDNVKHVPGGGAVKIESQKLEFKAQSKVGSLDNVKHKPGGGDVKIFDDKTYLKQISTNSSEGGVSGTQSYGDLSVVREVEGRTAPGTAGSNTRIKIKKTTIVSSSGPDPGVKNTTEVLVASKTPVKEKKSVKSKQEIKLTYSKIDPADEGIANSVGKAVKIVRVPANENAPILKPNLSSGEVKDGKIRYELYEKDDKSIRPGNADSNTVRAGGSNARQSSDSPDLPDGKFNLRNESDLSAFMKAEVAAHEKLGQMWAERNNQNGTTFHTEHQGNTPYTLQTHGDSSSQMFFYNNSPQDNRVRERQINSMNVSQSNAYNTSTEGLPQTQKNHQNYQTQQQLMSEQRQQQSYLDTSMQQHNTEY